MSDDKSIVRADSNRRNAQLSTGPKTEAGKKRSSLNAIRHGLCSSANVCTPNESQDEFLDFRGQLWEDFDPQDMVEALLLDRVATSAWRLRRIAAIEAGMLGSQEQPHWEFRRSSSTFDKLNRYEASIVKDFYRSVELLETRVRSRGSRAADRAMDSILGALAG